MNPQYEEHLRDSAPDASRFDGFDRGDSGRELLVIDEEAHLVDLDKLEARLAAADIKTVRSPRGHGKSVALALLASLGGLGNRLSVAPEPPMADLFHSQHTDGNRRLERDELKRLGRRQYRRATRKSYALRKHALVA